MLSRNVLFYGKDEALPERVDLRAGPLSMVYERGDLRYIKLGSRELLRRIYVAIRDRNWGTILPVFSNIEMEIGEQSFRISYKVENKQDEIDFVWQGIILGEVDGSISFTMDGEARSTFLKNRIGFCVLHPAACAGALCEVEHVDGTREKAELPYIITAKQPVPPFAEMRRLSHQAAPGTWMDVQFEGDIFEMEDQRNWTDASFKTFCTPLRIPYPAVITKGTCIHQSIRLSLRWEDKGSQTFPAGHSAESALVTLSADPSRSALPIPPIGLGMASHGQPLSLREAARLKALHLHHLRVDLDLQRPDFSENLSQAVEQARQLDVTLEAAVLLQPDSLEGLQSLAELVEKTQPPVSTWLVYPSRELFQGGSPVREVVEMARQALGGKIPGAIFAAGTNTDFIFMQRSLPPFDEIDEVTFSICPQVHAFDNPSLVETLEAQPQAVASAQQLAGGLPVRVSPATLKMRFNPYATGPVAASATDELPPQVDVRQMSLFGAGWTLGSLNALASSGVSSLTYFETTGWRGVLETESGSPIPQVFPSIPGSVYPVYFFFAALGEFAGGEILPTISTDTMAVSGLLVQKGNQRRMLIANHTEKKQRIRIPGQRLAAIFLDLNENNIEIAMRKPEEFLDQPGTPITSTDGDLTVELPPYAFGWVDE